MKKLLLITFVSILFLSCTQEKSIGIDTEKKLTPATESVCSERINDEIDEFGDDWCTETDIIDAHLIGGTDYINLQRAWQTTTIKEKKIYWWDVKQLINNVHCYDKFVQFDFTRKSKDNASIHIELTDCFFVKRSCFSVPFLLLMADKHKLNDDDALECTIAKNGDLEIVIFKVEDKDSPGQYSHYDVSDFPKYVEEKFHR